MAVTDVGIATGGLGTIIADAIVQFNKANVFWNLITTKAAPPGSLNVTFPKYTKVASSSVTSEVSGDEDNEPSITSITTAAETLEVLRNVIRADITDLVRYGSDDDVFNNAGAILGNAVAAKFDDDCVGEFGDFTAHIDNSDAAITLMNVFDAVEALHTAGAPTVNGKYFGVFHPKQIWGTYGLINDIDGIAFDKTNEFINAGYVGNIAGVEIFTTPEISADEGTNSDEATGLIFSPQAIAGAYKEINAAGFMNIETQRDVSKALTEIVANGYWNVGDLVDEYGCRITTQAHV